MNLQDLLHAYFAFGFPLSASGWDRFAVVELLAPQEPFAPENARYAVRRLADAYNRRPHPTGATPPAVRAEEFLALGVLTDALRYVCLHYGLRQRPGALAESYAWARRRVGAGTVDGLPPAFVDLFPPRDVALGRQAGPQWLREGEPQLRAAERVVVESILLYLMMRNRATRPLREVFDDGDLQRRAGYVPFVVSLEEFFDGGEPSGLTGQTLFHTLRAPILASPDDLAGQLAYIRAHWAHILPPELVGRLDLARDLLRELDLHRAPVYGPPPVPSFPRAAEGGWPEPAAFSRDADWMSNVVLIAKSTHVWLDQLGKRHGRPVRTLADVPDAELDRLAGWGFTGLWLIGLWERSRASARIKQYMGNPEAVASAYSLAEYRIADDLGGEAAYRDLRERASRRGLRLASDMVPNHMGLDSRWVVEHPDWFLQTRRPPYPVYRFTGGDLCDDPRVEVRIEEGYWSRTDAAVVFERRDAHTGDVRYLYHGNDGTSMPWNDTAQLDFTRADVREAVIQTILHVARMFPIIRFDAAMTLARKHYQRLWFPAPGDAGAIPSRAEHGLSREAFLALMPQEFWREVVDRVAAEVPDTLLLAEAFWLMEGYFVRTLGMHRVYNSAFMNMLKMEENAKFRQTVKNVLEFSPEVLKRFVNFMNNPDERTAVEQFGKGDKYFGVAVMMVTMPGLPMFGHGQIEGFAEKYGMEYRRAYWDEPVDDDMVRRHERDVFPLLRRRALFSGAEHFAFFDFVTGAGQVDENVFAYTNRHGDQRAVVFYNNAYESTAGRIHTSCAINAAAANRDPFLVRRSLVEALDLDTRPGVYHACRDPIAGHEFLRSGEELARDGLHAMLRGYQYEILIDFRALEDPDGRWGRLHRDLAGRPVASLARELRARDLAGVLEPLARANDAAVARGLAAGDAAARATASRELEAALAAARAAGGSPTPLPSPAVVDARLVALAAGAPARDDAVVVYLADQLGWLAAALGRPDGEPGPAPAVARGGSPAAPPRRLDDDDLALIEQAVAGPLAGALADQDLRTSAVPLAELLSRHGDLVAPAAPAAPAAPWRRLFGDPRARAFLGCHDHQGTSYFHRERFERLVGAARRRAEVATAAEPGAAGVEAIAAIAASAVRAAEAAGYREGITLARLAEAAGADAPPPATGGESPPPATRGPRP